MHPGLLEGTWFVYIYKYICTQKGPCLYYRLSRPYLDPKTCKTLRKRRNSTEISTLNLNRCLKTVLEFLNNLRRLRTSRNTVIVPGRQATQAGGIDSLESIPSLFKSFKIRERYRVQTYTLGTSIRNIIKFFCSARKLKETQLERTFKLLVYIR